MDSSKTRIWRGGLAAITQGQARDEAKPSGPDLHATRVMPIERLLPAPASAHPPPSASRARKRRWPLVVAALSTLIVVMGLQLRLLRARLPPAPAEEPHLVAPANTETPLPVALAPSVEPSPAPQPKASNAAERSQLERAAVDAVITGDYAGAARIYGKLREFDENPAFGSAARILEARKAAP